MNYDHVFIKSDILSLISARLIQLTTSDSILLLHSEAEVGMPSSSCGIFSSLEILDQLELDPLPDSMSISSSSLRSEWFEKHLAIILANNGASISTRATITKTSSNHANITGATAIFGDITFNNLHDINPPKSNSHQWYCSIHSNPPPSEITIFSQRSDLSFESWSKNKIKIPNTFETRIGVGTLESPNTIDMNLEICHNYLEQYLN